MNSAFTRREFLQSGGVLVIGFALATSSVAVPNGFLIAPVKVLSPLTFKICGSSATAPDLPSSQTCPLVTVMPAPVAGANSSVPLFVVPP